MHAAALTRPIGPPDEPTSVDPVLTGGLRNGTGPGLLLVSGDRRLLAAHRVAAEDLRQHGSAAEKPEQGRCGEVIDVAVPVSSPSW